MISSHPLSTQPGRSDIKALRDLLLAGRELDALAYVARFSAFEAWTDLDAARRAAVRRCASGSARRSAQERSSSAPTGVLRAR